MKHSISNYIWIVIILGVLIVFIAFTTPFSNFLGNSFEELTNDVYIATTFRVNDGFKEIKQNENWEYTVTGLTAPINDECTKITYDEFVSLTGITPDGDFDSSEEYAIGITLANYTGKSGRVVVPNMYEADGKVYVVTNVGPEETENDLSNPDNIFADNPVKVSSAIISKGVSVNNYAFAECPRLNTVIAVSSDSVGKYAFSSCPNLKRVNLDGDIREIGRNAFANCEGLKELKLGEKLEKIDNFAFYKCISIRSIRLPKSLKIIGNYAFFDCRLLSDINLKNSNVEFLGSSAFEKCDSLSGSLILPDTIQMIGKKAFYNLKTLNGTLKLPAKVECIGDSAFESCNFISTDFTQLDSLTVIGNRAFADCHEMTFVFAAPGTLNYIGSEAFANCWKCYEAFLNEGLYGIGTSAFKDIRISTHKSFPMIIPSTLEFAAGKLVISDDLSSVGFDGETGHSQYSIAPKVSEYIVAEGNPFFYVEESAVISERILKRIE